jgi:hypothetical protein
MSCDDGARQFMTVKVLATSQTRRGGPAEAAGRCYWYPLAVENATAMVTVPGATVTRD